MPGLSNLEDRIRGVMELLLDETEADALLMVTMTEEGYDRVSVETALAAPTEVAEEERLPFIIARSAEEHIRVYDDLPEGKTVQGTGAFSEQAIMETLDAEIPDLDPIEPEYDGFEEPEDGAEMPPVEPTFYVEVEMFSPPRGDEGSVTVTERAHGNDEEIVRDLRRIANRIEAERL